MAHECIKQRIVVGISGASGIPVASAVLKLLRKTGKVESHVILSESAIVTMRLEAPQEEEKIRELSDVLYDNHNIGAAVASGTFPSMGMIIVPCSMKTIAGVAAGYTDSLLLRAADVTLKERRPLVMAVRECPLNSIHLRNMKTLCDIGADIMPLVMTFYNQPKTIDDMVHHIACKCLDRFSLEPDSFTRWQ